MTPTLYGRWQSRIFLLGTIGSFVTWIITIIFGTNLPWVMLAYVIIIGFLWDLLYNFLQTYRWDRDWPIAYQFFAGVWEAVFLFIFVTLLRGVLPGVPNDLPGNFPTVFWVHYSLVWLDTFLASQSLMRLIFPRWRYRGGEWLAKRW